MNNANVYSEFGDAILVESPRRRVWKTLLLILIVAMVFFFGKSSK